MALNLDDLIMSDEGDITPMKEPPLFNISKNIKRNSIEDDSSGSDSSYCEFAKESAKKMTSLIGEVQLAKIEKDERISNARNQKKKELDEKKKLYQRGKNFNKKDNTSNSGIKSSSSKSSYNKTVNSGNVVQTSCDNERNKSSSSANPNQSLGKSMNKSLTKDLNQQQNKSKILPKNKSKNNEKTKPNLISKFNNITIQDFGIDSTDSSDYESDNSSNNLSDNELLKSRAAAKLFTVKNLNESSFYFVDIDSSSDSDNGKKNIRHFQSYGKRMAASKRNKNLNKKRINYNKNNVETDNTNELKNTSGNFFLKDNIIENQNKIISNDKTFENRNQIKLDQNPSTSKQIIQNQDGKIQSNFIPSTSKSLLQDLFEQTRRKNTDKSLKNNTTNQKYDPSIGQINDKEVKNKNNLIKNEVDKARDMVKADKQELNIKSKDSTKKNKKKKELKSTDEVKKVEKAKESKSTDGVKKVEKTKSTDEVKKVEKTKASKSTDGLKKVEKRKELNSKDQVKKFEKMKEQKWKAVEQKEIALSKANNQRIFNKNKFDSNEISNNSKFDDDIDIISEIKLNQNKPKIINKIDDSINITKKIDNSINIDNTIDDSINIDDLILDSYTSSSYHHDKTINSSNIAGKSKINESDSESDIDFNTILKERKKKVENVITENKIVKNNDSIIDPNLKFKSKGVSNESSSDCEAEFEASLQLNYRNKFKK